MEEVTDREALVVMQQVAACVKAVYQLVGQCKVTKEDCDNLLEKIDSISSPLEAMSGSSNLSQDVKESLDRLVTILGQAKATVTEAMAKDQAGQVEPADVAAVSETGEGNDAEDEENKLVMLIGSLLFQISSLYKKQIINEEQRGILKDLVVAGQYMKVAEILAPAVGEQE